MARKWRIVSKIVYWLVVLVVASLAGLTLLATFAPNKLTARFFVVQSGSMHPAISAGSLILVDKGQNYYPGDIITYSRGRTLTTHRLVEIRDQGFVTKGDANQATDSAVVKKEQILGKVVLAVPYLGYPVSFTKTLPGLILVVVIPATIIVYQELVNLKNDIVKRWFKRQDEKAAEK